MKVPAARQSRLAGTVRFVFSFRKFCCRESEKYCGDIYARSVESSVLLVFAKLLLGRRGSVLSHDPLFRFLFLWAYRV